MSGKKAGAPGETAKAADAIAKRALSEMKGKDAQMYPGAGNKTNHNPQGNPGGRK